MEIIDGTRLVEALALPSHDKKVLSLLKELGLKRPMKDENYDGISTYAELDHAYFLFNESIITEKQRSNAYGKIDFYVKEISVKHKQTNISPPFDIEWGDNYDTVKQKIGKKADYGNEYTKEQKSWLLEDEEKIFFLRMIFDNTKFERLITYSMAPFNKDANYTMPINED
jgi:hypothetical protein